jgi:hypothetical protein
MSFPSPALMFCKKLHNDKKYILSDQYKQPLICHGGKNKCMKFDYKKVIDNPDKYNSIGESVVIEESNIPCNYDNKAIIDNNINLNDYKTIILKDNDLEKISGEEEDKLAKTYIGSIISTFHKKQSDELVTDKREKNGLVIDRVGFKNAFETASNKFELVDTSTSNINYIYIGIAGLAIIMFIGLLIHLWLKYKQKKL